MLGARKGNSNSHSAYCTAHTVKEQVAPLASWAPAPVGQVDVEWAGFVNGPVHGSDRPERGREGGKPKV